MAASRAALKAGIAPGMALADARAILPGLLAADADPAEDHRALSALAEWCGRYTPWVTPDGAAMPGGGAAILLDATGCAHLFGGETRMLEDVTARTAALGLTVRAGMASTPGAARALARWTSGGRFAVAAPDATEAALAPLPAAALGLAPAAAAQLASLGLRMVGEVAALPRAALASRFGAAVLDPLDRALGRAPEPVSPAAPPVRHAARLAFAEPVARSEDIAAGLDRLLAALCAGLEREGQGARRLVLALYEPDGRTRQIHLGASRATRDPAHLARLFAEHLDGIDAAFGFDAMTLVATTAEALAARQAPLADRTAHLAGPSSAGAREGTNDTLAALIDRLANRLGSDAVLRLAARESRLPERAAVAVPALEFRPQGAAPFAPPGAPARPLRLLPRPEPVETVALLPDDPPALFRWRRVAHRVARAEGPERIAPEWWRARETDERDYWRVEDERGGRFWLYRAGPAWYLHGVYG